MIQIEDRILVRTPLRQTFRFAARPENMPRWNQTVLESTLKGPLRRGAVVEQRIDLLGHRFDAVFEVTCYHPFRKVTYASIRGPVDLEGTMQFQPAPSGTLIQWVVYGDCRRFLRVAEPILVSLGRKGMHDCLEKLRCLSEEARGALT